MFGLFKKKYAPESTARSMAEAYKEALRSGQRPKAALDSVYRIAAGRDGSLARIPSETYFSQVHSSQYPELSDSPDEAAPLVTEFIMNLICVYLHPEISTFNLSPFSSDADMQEYERRNELKDSLESLILGVIG